MPTRSELNATSSFEGHSGFRTTLRQADYSFVAKGSTDEDPSLSQFTHHYMHRMPAAARQGSRIDMFS
jgi:hypothetical protein